MLLTFPKTTGTPKFERLKSPMFAVGLLLLETGELLSGTSGPSGVNKMPRARNLLSIGLVAPRLASPPPLWESRRARDASCCLKGQTPER